jgi:biotin transport system substrate-specific component
MNTTLIGRLWPQTVTSTLSQLLLVIAGTLLLAVSAKVQVPFWPVPMTMQTFVVLLIGAAYGARLAGFTLAAYLAEGAAGLPVFAKGAGLAYMAGPTGGYLAGFVIAAVVVGWLADRGYGRAVVTTLVAFLAGEVIIFALGVGWLAGGFPGLGLQLAGGFPGLGLQKALAEGLMPFLPAEALKIALACAVLPLAWRTKTRG